MVDHYFSAKPRSSLAKKDIRVEINRDGLHSFSLQSASGLFSKDKLDSATRLLIEKCDLSGQKILDLGCGYGVVGIAIKKIFPEKEVWMSDVNERAVEIAQANVKLQKIEATVVKSDLFESLEKFDCILSNPPYAAGRELCFMLIQESHNHLSKGGTLQLVARHNKGGKALGEEMKRVFGNMETLAKRGGFRVYKSSL